MNKQFGEKIINIPSVKSEGSNLTLKIESNRSIEAIPWKIKIECKTPNFSGYYSGQIEDGDLKRFVDELKDVEKVRKGDCHVYDEWGFALTIRSIDSVGHFVVDVAIWNPQEHAKNHANQLEIIYQIEPSLLTVLLKDFTSL
mgnify:CR=1 FL=1